MQMHHIDFTLNDASVTCAVPSHWTLHDVLCHFDIFPTLPQACLMGDCCRCTVLLDGRAVCACQVLALEVAGGTVQTRAGLAAHPVVEALEAVDGPCGRCIDAFALATVDYLHTRPTRHGPEEGLAAIPCSCHVAQHTRRVVQQLAPRGRYSP